MGASRTGLIMSRQPRSWHYFFCKKKKSPPSGVIKKPADLTPATRNYEIRSGKLRAGAFFPHREDSPASIFFSPNRAAGFETSFPVSDIVRKLGCFICLTGGGGRGESAPRLKKMLPLFDYGEIPFFPRPRVSPLPSA